MADRARAVPAYSAALLIGVLAVLAAMPLPAIIGVGGLWTMPGDDPAVALTGHLAYQAPGWHWPLLLAKNLGWPAGSSIALTDSNPLVSMVAKLAAACIGRRVNLFGIWIALCWILQPVAATYALRSFDRRGLPLGAMCAAAVLSLLCPAWLMRVHHLNLLGHFLLLTAFGLAVRMTRTVPPRRWWRACLLLTVAILVHPYLFVFAAVVLAAPVLHHAVVGRWTAWRSLAAYGLCCSVPFALFWTLSGTLGRGNGGFGVYSMNLLSPFWPQASGLFGAGLPVIDATGGQYEGFNYEGGGVLLLAAAAIVSLWRDPLRDPVSLRRAGAVIVPLALLTLLALTPRMYAGHWLVLPLPLSPWDTVLAPIRASGRAFWMVGYASMLGSVALLSSRLTSGMLTALLAGAIALQLIDTMPLRGADAAFFAGAGESALPFALPRDADLLRIVPPCDYAPATVADRLRLAAVRQGWRLADMRLAHAPSDSQCNEGLSAGLHAPLAPGEVRFFLPSAVPSLQEHDLGPGAVCARSEAGVLCTRAEPNAGRDPK